MNYKIKELGKVITGKTPSTKNDEFYDSNDYKFICPPDIKNQRFTNNADKYISKIAFEKHRSIKIPRNSILIDCIGADLGNVALSSDDCITNQQINSIVDVKSDLASPLYLYYLFSTKKEYFHLIGQNGSTMPIINKSMFENIEISIHPIQIQQHIVNTIGTIDNLIEFTTKKIENLEQLGTQLYSSKINEDYRLLKVSSLNIHYGESIPKSKRQKGVIPLYASNGITDFIDGNNASKNTIIFGCRGTLGNVFFAKKKCFVLNTSFYITDVKYYGGLYFALKFNKGFTLFSSGAAQPQITIDAIKNAEVKIPIDNDLNYLLDCISINEELLNKLKKIKEILLAKYF